MFSDERIIPEPSHEGEVGMVVMMAIKSMSHALKKAAEPFGCSPCPAAALETSVPTRCQHKLFPAGLGWAASPHTVLLGHGAQWGCVTASPRQHSTALGMAAPRRVGRGAVVATTALLGQTSPYHHLTVMMVSAGPHHQCCRGEQHSFSNSRYN